MAADPPGTGWVLQAADMKVLAGGSSEGLFRGSGLREWTVTSVMAVWRLCVSPAHSNHHVTTAGLAQAQEQRCEVGGRKEQSAARLVSC